MSETTPGETPVERRLREMSKELERFDPADALTLDAGREALKIAREGIPSYLQNGGCSNCGALPHTATCLVGQFAALLARCGEDA
jgi:hypothetical protein